MALTLGIPGDSRKRPACPGQDQPHNGMPNVPKSAALYPPFWASPTYVAMSGGHPSWQVMYRAILCTHPFSCLIMKGSPKQHICFLKQPKEGRFYFMSLETDHILPGECLLQRQMAISACLCRSCPPLTSWTDPPTIHPTATHSSSLYKLTTCLLSRLWQDKCSLQWKHFHSSFNSTKFVLKNLKGCHPNTHKCLTVTQVSGVLR